MNWFMIVIGLQYLGAMVLEMRKRNWAMSVVYLAYGVSAFALGVAK